MFGWSRGGMMTYLALTKTNRIKAAVVGSGIQKNVARHTYATTILRDNDIPFEIISNLLGHTNLKQTKIYAKNSDKFMDKLADEIERKIRKKKEE